MTTTTQPEQATTPDPAIVAIVATISDDLVFHILDTTTREHEPSQTDGTPDERRARLIETFTRDNAAQHLAAIVDYNREYYP